MAARLYVPPDKAASILEDLVKRQVARSETENGVEYYQYEDSWNPGGERIALVATTYQRQLKQVSLLIHSKASTAVRDFARAFKLKKEE
jgi:hypothetical protein